MTINDRIKALRMNLNMTQIEFGEKIGVSQGHLTSIEHGKRAVTDKTLIVICEKYNVSEEWLREGKGDMFLPQSELDSILKKKKFTPIIVKMLTAFDALTPAQQDAVLLYFEKLTGSGAFVEQTGTEEHTYEEIARLGIETAHEASRKLEKEQKKTGSA